MQINLQLQPLIALIAGVLILVAPRILNYVVAIYLILLRSQPLPEFAAVIAQPNWLGRSSLG